MGTAKFSGIKAKFKQCEKDYCLGPSVLGDLPLGLSDDQAPICDCWVRNFGWLPFVHDEAASTDCFRRANEIPSARTDGAVEAIHFPVRRSPAGQRAAGTVTMDSF
jgi:hypothetical protein